MFSRHSGGSGRELRLKERNSSKVTLSRRENPRWFELVGLSVFLGVFPSTVLQAEPEAQHLPGRGRDTIASEERNRYEQKKPAELLNRRSLRVYLID